MYETEYRTPELIGPVLSYRDNSSTVTYSNDEGHNGEVLKIKMIKIRTKCSTE